MSANVSRVAASLLGLVFATTAAGADWPQWRGPERNGVSNEKGLLAQWPEGGPNLLWMRPDIGSGYAAPAVAGGTIYVISNEGIENEFVQALSAADGKQIWSQRLGKVGNPNQQPSYPAARSTPTVDGEVLYALGSDGDLAAIETGNGNVRWRRNLRTDFGGEPGAWAYSESPLIDGDVVVCTPGGAEATVVGLNKLSGDLVWKCAVPGDSKAAFASAVITEAGGKRFYVQMVEKGLIGIEPGTGKLLWHFAKAVSRYGANIPTPLVSGKHVFWASAGTGAGLIELSVRDSEIEVREVYTESKLPTAIGGVVKVGDYLYGTGSQTLMCVEFQTGKVVWEERVPSAASICYADERLYLHHESGEVSLVEPSPEGLRLKGRFAPPDRPAPAFRGEKAWAYPAIADGRLFLREHGTLWCFSIRSGR